jgi:hypothetical protein
MAWKTNLLSACLTLKTLLIEPVFRPSCKQPWLLGPVNVEVVGPEAFSSSGLEEFIAEAQRRSLSTASFSLWYCSCCNHNGCSARHAPEMHIQCTLSRNPRRFGAWLLAECYRANIQVRTNSRISGVKLSDEGVLQFVSIFSAQCSETLPCDDLVLGAGPWSPRLFKELFPSANLDFHETTNSGNWVVVKSPASLSAESFCKVICYRFKVGVRWSETTTQIQVSYTSVESTTSKIPLKMSKRRSNPTKKQ